MRICFIFPVFHKRDIAVMNPQAFFCRMVSEAKVFLFLRTRVTRCCVHVVFNVHGSYILVHVLLSKYRLLVSGKEVSSEAKAP